MAYIQILMVILMGIKVSMVILMVIKVSELELVPYYGPRV